MQQFGSWLTGTLSLDVLRLKPEQGVHKVESELEGSKKQAWGFEFNAQFASLRPHRVSVASADGEDGGQMHLVMLDDSLLILCVPDELLSEDRRGDGDTTFVGIKQQLEWEFRGL
ncbi:hypothetical protein HBH98_203390 [Parastagonospora nodorum]|nr:hypothetical protein HBI09_226550 [Parastagonospora nodorum]KAH4048547.1 hypothetical protein HBH49_160040 [Parastagonospora nodorum]KAH4119973.1 hypothetical protein HBH47_119960 [Parastagonospora nodorum]KAH4188750.1 hypothetical protein HBI95_229560 [Parastagonospora nodorum]KAH4189099.1 hypothetical protein HBH42_139350 [Parastagonospora nodorum]